MWQKEIGQGFLLIEILSNAHYGVYLCRMFSIYLLIRRSSKMIVWTEEDASHLAEVRLNNGRRLITTPLPIISRLIARGYHGAILTHNYRGQYSYYTTICNNTCGTQLVLISNLEKVIQFRLM